MSDLVGSFTDRNGNVVTLTRERWQNHILRKHPDLYELLGSFQRILGDPRRITQDTSLSSCRCFYRDGIVPRLLVKIVVEYPRDDPTVPLFTPVVGTIITAYLTLNVKARDRPLWP